MPPPLGASCRFLGWVLQAPLSGKKVRDYMPLECNTKRILDGVDCDPSLWNYGLATTVYSCRGWARRRRVGIPVICVITHNPLSNIHASVALGVHLLRHSAELGRRTDEVPLAAFLSIAANI